MTTKEILGGASLGVFNMLMRQYPQGEWHRVLMDKSNATSNLFWHIVNLHLAFSHPPMLTYQPKGDD